MTSRYHSCGHMVVKHYLRGVNSPAQFHSDHTQFCFGNGMNTDKYTLQIENNSRISGNQLWVCALGLLGRNFICAGWKENAKLQHSGPVQGLAKPWTGFGKKSCLLSEIEQGRWGRKSSPSCTFYTMNFLSHVDARCYQLLWSSPTLAQNKL